jgi:uncharacterized protein YjiS (DUF1127 family)
MSTIYDAPGLRQTAVSIRRISCLLKGYWDAFQEQRERERLRAALYALNDRELQDIGIAYDQIDYVASNRGIDPRGANLQPYQSS